MRPTRPYLSKREQQIVEILYREGRITANEVMERMPDAPSNSTVRKLLSILETKGHVKHQDVDGKYLYFATEDKEQAGKNVLLGAVETFFAGSMAKTVAALLTGGSKINGEELAYIEDLIRKAKEES
jgi:BlaI family penicillinase repressor